MGRGFIDGLLVAKISTGSRRMKIYSPGKNRWSDECSDPWAWTYLRACLATAIGLDEAREVVDLVRWGRGA